MNRTLDEYLALPYTKVVKKDSEGDFVARVLELPGCVADGATEAEALDVLAEAQRLWIEDALEANHEIPEPVVEEEALPSGKWLLRLPRSLHRKLIARARVENVSLNQLAATLLAEGIGARSARSEPVKAQPAMADWVHAAFDRDAQRYYSWHHDYTGFRDRILKWIVDAPSLRKATGFIPGDAVLYLDALTHQLPDHWQGHGSGLISTQELGDVHRRSRVSEVSKKPAAHRTGSGLVQRKG